MQAEGNFYNIRQHRFKHPSAYLLSACNFYERGWARGIVVPKRDEILLTRGVGGRMEFGSLESTGGNSKRCIRTGIKDFNSYSTR